MATFNNVEVIKTIDNYFYIEWEFVPDSGHLENEYEFTILWSTDPESGFQHILDEMGDPIVVPPNQNYYTHQLKHFNFNIDRYYIIKSKATFPPEEETESSPPVYVGMFTDGVLETIHRNENIRLTQYCGEPAHIIKKHTFGAKCPNCWNEYRDDIAIGHCPICHGSKFLYGWYQPISVQIDTAADPKKSDSQKTGEDIYDTLMFRMANFPLVRPGDLVVLEGSNQRYEIVHVDTTKLPLRATPNDPAGGNLTLSKQNYIVSQIMTVKEWVSSDDPYNINIEGIPEIPDGDQPGGGYTPPDLLTVDPPLKIEGRHLSFLYDEDDFGVDENGFFFLKAGGGTELSFQMTAGEDILDQFKAVVAVSNELFLADYSNAGHFNRVSGISILTGVQGSVLTVVFGGTLTYNSWSWDESKKIFFDQNGNLTQTFQPTGFYQYLGYPLNSNTIRVDVGRPIHRVD